MMTAKATAVLVLAYVLALAAGTTSGVLAERLRSPNSSATSAPLAAQLQLNDDQREQMRGAWEDAKDAADDCYKQAQEIQRQRDQALVDMLSDEQKAKFAPIDQGYARQFAALTTRRESAFEQAMAKTEAILTPDQRVKYEEIVRERLGQFPAQAGGVSGPGATTEPSIDDLRP
jgi:Spy/CpxP family protein refolding chaperone